MRCTTSSRNSPTPVENTTDPHQTSLQERRHVPAGSRSEQSGRPWKTLHSMSSTPASPVHLPLPPEFVPPVAFPAAQEVGVCQYHSLQGGGGGGGGVGALPQGLVVHKELTVEEGEANEEGGSGQQLHQVLHLHRANLSPHHCCCVQGICKARQTQRSMKFASYLSMLVKLE